MAILAKGHVAPAPEGFHERVQEFAEPGEKPQPWSILVHKNPQDFCQDSYGATAGFMAEHTEVQILKRWTITMSYGQQEGEELPLVRVRGLDENGKQITGWTRARHIAEVQEPLGLVESIAREEDRRVLAELTQIAEKGFS